MRILFILLTLSFVLSACNTVHGMGQDIEKAGEAVKKSTQ